MYSNLMELDWLNSAITSWKMLWPFGVLFLSSNSLISHCIVLSCLLSSAGQPSPEDQEFRLGSAIGMCPGNLIPPSPGRLETANSHVRSSGPNLVQSLSNLVYTKGPGSALDMI